MARPCRPLHADLQAAGACHWCDLGRDPESPYAKLWAGVPVPPSPAFCLHLGPVVPTESQRTHYRCEAGHGTVCPCKQCRGCPDYAPDA